MSNSILGFQVYEGTLSECASAVVVSLSSQEQKPVWLACLNPHSYAVARRDREFQNALHGADWLIPDGIGIVLAGRLLGGAFPERVTGPDMFDAVMRWLNEERRSVFFLGGSEKTLHLVEEKTSELFPGIRFAGSYSPPYSDQFTDEDTRRMVEAVNFAKPDVLWVGMTAPKQEKWLSSNIHLLDIRFAGAVGAVFDFYTGQVKRSHPAFQRVGLEWLPRLLREPRRLWKRMFISAPLFTYDLCKALVSVSADNRRKMR